MLRTYRIYNPTIGFSKYEFNNKLLSNITLLKVIPSVCVYIYNLSSSYTWYNIKQYYNTRYFLI